MPLAVLTNDLRVESYLYLQPGDITRDVVADNDEHPRLTSVTKELEVTSLPLHGTASNNEGHVHTVEKVEPSDERYPQALVQALVNRGYHAIVIPETVTDVLPGMLAAVPQKERASIIQIVQRMGEDESRELADVYRKLQEYADNMRASKQRELEKMNQVVGEYTSSHQ